MVQGVFYTDVQNILHRKWLYLPFQLSRNASGFECQNEVSAVLLSNFSRFVFLPRLSDGKQVKGFFILVWYIPSPDSRRWWSHTGSGREGAKVCPDRGRRTSLTPSATLGVGKKNMLRGKLGSKRGEERVKKLQQLAITQGRSALRSGTNNEIYFSSLSLRSVMGREATCLERERWPGNWVKRRRERLYSLGCAISRLCSHKKLHVEIELFVPWMKNHGDS